MEFCFSEDFLKILEFSRDEALRTGWHNIGVEHIMLGILRQADNDAYRTLEAAGVCIADFKTRIDEAVFVGDEQIPWSERESIHLRESTCSVLQLAALEMMRCHAPELTPLHFLLAVIRSSGSYCSDYLNDCGISLRAMVEASGLDWSQYGTALFGDDSSQPGGAPLDNPAVLSPGEESPDALGQLPDPSIIAAALEERLRAGFDTGNPLAS